MRNIKINAFSVLLGLAVLVANVNILYDKHVFGYIWLAIGLPVALVTIIGSWTSWKFVKENVEDLFWVNTYEYFNCYVFMIFAYLPMVIVGALLGLIFNLVIEAYKRFMDN